MPDHPHHVHNPHRSQAAPMQGCKMQCHAERSRPLVLDRSHSSMLYTELSMLAFGQEAVSTSMLQFPLR